MNESLEAKLKNLATVSGSLNAASDALSDAVRGIEAILKSLNLGVSAWVGVPNEGHCNISFGYAKVAGKWGLAIRKRPTGGDTTQEEVWHFSEAPRWMRALAIGKLPNLLDELISTSQRVAEEIGEAVKLVKEYVSAIKEVR